jgi:hypothetical protein
MLCRKAAILRVARPEVLRRAWAVAEFHALRSTSGRATPEVFYRAFLTLFSIHPAARFLTLPVIFRDECGINRVVGVHVTEGKVRTGREKGRFFKKG